MCTTSCRRRRRGNLRPNLSKREKSAVYRCPRVSVSVRSLNVTTRHWITGSFFASGFFLFCFFPPTALFLFVCFSYEHSVGRVCVNCRDVFVCFIFKSMRMHSGRGSCPSRRFSPEWLLRSETLHVGFCLLCVVVHVREVASLCDVSWLGKKRGGGGGG